MTTNYKLSNGDDIDTVLLPRAGNGTTGSVVAYGNTAYQNGAMLGVYGSAHSSRPGQVFLSASTGTDATTDVVVKPGDGLYVSGKKVLVTGDSAGGGSYPNGSKAIVNFTFNSASNKSTDLGKYTVPVNALVYLPFLYEGGYNNTTVTYTINGNVFAPKVYSTSYTEPAVGDNYDDTNVVVKYTDSIFLLLPANTEITLSVNAYKNSRSSYYIPV